VSFVGDRQRRWEMLYRGSCSTPLRAASAACLVVGGGGGGGGGHWSQAARLCRPTTSAAWPGPTCGLRGRRCEEKRGAREGHRVARCGVVCVRQGGGTPAAPAGRDGVIGELHEPERPSVSAASSLLLLSPWPAGLEPTEAGARTRAGHGAYYAGRKGEYIVEGCCTAPLVCHSTNTLCRRALDT